MKEPNRIAIVFDFDDTLGPDSTTAYLNQMIDATRNGAHPITKDSLASFGPEVTFYEGAPEIFSRLREHAAGVNCELEFYVVSSGIGEVLRHTAIAEEFTDIFASDFAYAEDGEIRVIKNVVSFTDKTRFLFQISKGLIGPGARSKPFGVNQKFAPGQLRIPFSQLVFVGDGYTDIPCFTLVKKEGGVPVAVYDREKRRKRKHAWEYSQDGRVSHVVAADYRAESGLSDLLHLSVENIARELELRGKTYAG